MSIEARPSYFPSGQHTLFGWIHPALEPQASDLGLVICNPFGYETICAHRSLRAFAEAAAAAGIPTLRFDYRGTGDSSGTPGEEDQISGWCDDVRAGIEFLERTCSVQRICLLGLRLGALLAARVAAERPVHQLVAVAPVTSGRRYVRELRALQASVAAGDVADAAAPAKVDCRRGMEVAGFPVSEAALNTLAQIDLSKLPAPSATSTLIIDRDDLPCARPWADALEADGVEVKYLQLAGFTNMVSTPHASVMPTAMISATMQWLEPHRRAGAPDCTRAIPGDGPVESRMRIEHENGPELIEQAMFIDRERLLFGIVTEPVSQAERTEVSADAVILLNTGATSHVGPNRMYVELARRWAARGYRVLRFDLAGLGDSATRPGQDPNQVYPPSALDDVRIAIDFLRTQRSTHEVILAGLCSGAYHGLRSAVAGLPVNTVLLVNPLTFYWKQGSRLEDLQISEVVRNPGVYAKNALSSRHWAKLIRGQVNLWRAGLVFLRRSWLTVESAFRDLCRRLRIHLPHDLGWDLQSVTERGIRVVFFFARGDTGHELLRLQGGTSLRRLGDRCHIHIIDDADHIFTQLPARMRLIELLSADLMARPSHVPPCGSTVHLLQQ